ncbi:amino acid ABC transporter substrate-binding protein [Antrihabitans sp. YC2-6]|nr:amino acid ABC transporter substrate-binding protein [Antrihabitans sp. YC2-6]
MLLAACSGSDNASESTTSATTKAGPAMTLIPPTTAVNECGPGSGVTVEDGVLTIATDSPAYEPWFVGNDPSNGKGFEGAVARNVAEKLGYTPENTQFVAVPFEEALAPGEKPFDFDINQVTILGDRREAVDFSAEYYAVAQSIVAMAGTPAAAAENLDDLSAFRLGAQRGSTSLAAIVETIRPTTPAFEFATTDDAKAALEDGRIDALVVDIPTGFQISNSQIEGSVLVGQFPRPNDVTEFFGLVLEKGSPMTPCVSAAVSSLYQEGVLDRLADEWLAQTAGAKVLE